MFTLAISRLITSKFILFHGPNIPDSYAILLFTALDFTLTTRHINWISFLLWPRLFILSGAISKYPLLFPSNILDPFWPGGLIFWFHVFEFPYCLWGSHSKNPGVVCHPSSSEPRFVRTLHLLALHGMFHSFRVSQAPSP